LEQWERTYPRDSIPHISLGVKYTAIGSYEKAVDEGLEAIRLNKDCIQPYVNMAADFVCLNRFDEAKVLVVEQLIGRKHDLDQCHDLLYLIAFIQGDAAAMEQQLDWARANSYPEEWEADTAAYRGQLRKSREATDRAVDVARKRNLKEGEAGAIEDNALRSACCGNCLIAEEYAARGLTLARNINTLSEAAMVWSLCGDALKAQSLANELTNRYPNNSFVNTTWLPVVQADIEIRRNNPARAIELLEKAKTYEAGLGGFAPAYVRGLAYLRLQNGTAAAVEFQKLLDHPGVVALGGNSSMIPMARLGLARAQALAGETARSRTAYQDFLALWKDADRDIRILQQAKEEYERIR